MREGKGYLVMHVKFAMYILISQLSILFYVSLSFPISIFFHFQLHVLILLGTVFLHTIVYVSLRCLMISCSSLILVAIFSSSNNLVLIFMGTIPFISKIKPM